MEDYKLGKWQFAAVQAQQAGLDALVAKCNEEVQEYNRKMGVMIAEIRQEMGVPEEYVVDVRTGVFVVPPAQPVQMPEPAVAGQ